MKSDLQKSECYVSTTLDNQTTHTHTHTHTHGKARFKALLVLLMFLMFFKTSIEAQSSCQNAKLAIPNDSIYIMNANDTVYWGVFYADSQYLTLQLDFWEYNVISNIQLFSGTCTSLNEVYVQKNPDNIVLFAENLTIGNYYIFKINKTTNNGIVRVRLDTKAPILNCNSGVCNDDISLSCDLVCNGNFEYYSQLPTGISQIGVACPWGSVNDANPDYYHQNSTNWLSSVPSNSMGDQYSYNYSNGDKAYAGFGVHDPNNIFTTGYYEYIYQKLKAPMIQGVTYNITMKVSRADNYRQASNHIGIYLSAQNPYFGQGIPGWTTGQISNTPSQTLIYNNYVTEAINWTTISFTYTPQISGIQYITIGDYGTTVFQNSGSGNVDGSYYFLDEVHITPSNMPSFSITANPNPICSGNITNITNSLNLPLNWSSSPSGYFSCPTACSSTNFTTSTQATVTGTYSVAPNCNSTASTVVNYIAPIKPIVNGKFNTCDLTSLYTITNPQAGTTYLWSIYPPSCGSLSPNSGANVNITWNPDNFPTEGFASIIITSSNGCTNRDTIKVWKCCDKYGSVLHDQTITSTLSPGTYALNGTIYFSGTFSSSDLVFNMGPETKIIVNTNSSISFNNTVMKAECSYMWDGITVNQGTSITVNNSEIRDAFNAITSENGANYTLYNTVFNKNLNGVNVKSYSGSHTGTISKCTFKCNNIGSDTPENLIIPYTNRRGIAGVIIQSVNNITVGNTTSTANTNIFKNMDYGVMVENSNVTFYNNAFGPMPLTSGYIIPDNGYGIFANKSALSGNILNIGSTIDNSVYKNSFTSCAVGLRSNSSYSLNVHRNVYTDNTFANFISEDYSRNINYTYNNFAKGTVGIWVNNFAGTSVNVSNNTMDNVPNGINLSNNTLTPVTSINITNNLIQMGLNPLVTGGDMINGIGLSNVQGSLQSRPYIYNNDIKFNSVNLSISQVRNGIQVSNSPFSMIELNRISYRNLPIITSQANRLNGINVILSTNTILCSNELKHLANGVRVEGYSDRSQFILNNFIRYNNATGSQSYGFRFESATVGVQGTSTRTWDNTFNTINFPLTQNKRGWGSIALQQQWNYRGGALNQDYWFDYPDRQQSVLNAMSRTYIPVPPSCGFQGFDFMNGMAGENEMSVETESEFLENNDENQYFKSYTMVNNDVSSNESEHYAVSNISSNIGSENISKFLAVNRLVNERLFNSADSLNQLIEPENLIEKNMQTVNEIYLRTWAKGEYNFNLEDYATLVDIAMQTPKTSGYGVIGAWVMVGRFENNQESEKFSNNKINIISNNIFMYPNPATSQLSFEGVEAVSYITIHDVMGRLVLNIDNKQLDNAISISINDLKKGIYIVSFTNDFGEKIGFEKLIIN